MCVCISITAVVKLDYVFLLFLCLFVVVVIFFFVFFFQEISLQSLNEIRTYRLLGPSWFSDS